MRRIVSRNGFTLIEMLVTVCVIGILASFAVPRVREARLRAEAAAFTERLHSIRVAYEAAGEPPATALVSQPGEVPALLRRELASGFFVGELGVKLRVTGNRSSKVAIVQVITPTAAQKRMMQLVQTQSAEPMIVTPMMSMLALSDEARPFVSSQRASPR